MSLVSLRLAPPLTQLLWRPPGVLSTLGATRGKKWKPFHNMHRAKVIREKKVEAERLRAAAREMDDDPEAAVTHVNEPVVSATPFQAVRLMRAFHVLPEEEANIRFRTKLNVDLTREAVRGTCNLPHGLSTKMRVLAFCPDDEAEEMLRAGADVAGITEPLRRIGLGWLGFDRCLATPQIMPQVMKVAKVLGPRKLMPNPKSGTVVTNLVQAIAEAKGGSLVEYRAEGAGEVQLTIGTEDFSDAKILENLKFLVQTLLRARPRSASTGGAGASKGEDAGKPLIKSAVQIGATGSPQADLYFLEASLQFGKEGPSIRMDPETVLPSSIGYFR